MVNANVIRFRSLFSCLTNGLIIRRSVVTCSVSVGAEQPLHRDRSNRLRLINYIFYFFIFRPQVYIHPEGLTMCGIWALFGVDVHSISKYDKTFSKIQHRGPDAWRLEYDLKVKVSNAWRWYTNESKIASQPHGGIGIHIRFWFPNLFCRTSVSVFIAWRLSTASMECNRWNCSNFHSFLWFAMEKFSIGCK